MLVEQRGNPGCGQWPLQGGMHELTCPCCVGGCLCWRLSWQRPRVSALTRDSQVEGLAECIVHLLSLREVLTVSKQCLYSKLLKDLVSPSSSSQWEGGLSNVLSKAAEPTARRPATYSSGLRSRHDLSRQVASRSVVGEGRRCSR